MTEKTGTSKRKMYDLTDGKEKFKWAWFTADELNAANEEANEKTDGNVWWELTESSDNVENYFNTMAEQADLFISAIGTNGDQYWVIINGQKVSVDRTQYFRLMLLSDENQNLTLEDAANFNAQMTTGIPAF